MSRDDRQTETQWQVVAARFGTRTVQKSRVYLNYFLYGDDDRGIEMDYFFWVLSGELGTVLVDTGFNAESGARRGRTLVIPPDKALAAAGFDPEQIDHTIVTHLHYDHAGNLDLGSVSKCARSDLRSQAVTTHDSLLPRSAACLHKSEASGPARLDSPQAETRTLTHALGPRAASTMARKEFDFWTGPFGRKELLHSAVEDRDIEAASRYVDSGRLTLTDGSVDYLPGITTLEVGGHTPGQTIVRVTTARGIGTAGIGCRSVLRRAGKATSFHGIDQPSRRLRRVRPDPGRGGRRRPAGART